MRRFVRPPPTNSEHRFCKDGVSYKNPHSTTTYASNGCSNNKSTTGIIVSTHSWSFASSRSTHPFSARASFLNCRTASPEEVSPSQFAPNHPIRTGCGAKQAHLLDPRSSNATFEPRAYNSNGNNGNDKDRELKNTARAPTLSRAES